MSSYRGDVHLPPFHEELVERPYAIEGNLLMRHIVLTVLLLACWLPAAVTQAATFTVTRTDDPAPNGCLPADCSLREAVIAANTNVGPDTIFVGADTFTLSIADPSGTENASLSGDLDLTSDITIRGVASSATSIQAGLSAGNGIDKIFQLLNDAEVTIRDLTVRYGTSDGCGGAILVSNGKLTFRSGVVVGNRANSGAGLCNFGYLRVQESRISDNIATDSGAIQNFGTAIIDASTMQNNQAAYGGAISNAGILSLINSTLLDNRAQFAGGVWNRATFGASNSTLSGNRASESGGGLLNDPDAQTTLSSSTIVNNRADDDLDGTGQGGGVSRAGGGTGSIRLFNTLLAGNQESMARSGGWSRYDSDCAGSGVQSDGFSLIEHYRSTRCTISGGAFVAADPLLGVLQNNGGPTLTHLPGAGSPAIDAGNPANCIFGNADPIKLDQRGIERPQGARCDLGAVEVEPAAPSAPPTPTPSASPSPAPSSNRMLLPMAQK